MGLWVFATQSYMSRIRGGLNWYDVRVADYRITSGRENADILIALTEEALATLRSEVVEGGLILFDGDEAEGAVAINFTQTAKHEGGSEVMANSVAGGTVFAILGYDIAHLTAFLDEAFHKKGEEVVETNRRLVRRGAELADEHAGSVAAPQPADAPRQAIDGTGHRPLRGRSGCEVRRLLPDDTLHRRAHLPRSARRRAASWSSRPRTRSRPSTSFAAPPAGVQP